jgi:hypothetical protein
MGIVDYARRMSIGLCDGPRQMERCGITELGVGRYKRLRIPAIVITSSRPS